MLSSCSWLIVIIITTLPFWKLDIMQIEQQGVVTKPQEKKSISVSNFMYSLYHTHIWRKPKIRSKQNRVFPPAPDTMTTMTE